MLKKIKRKLFDHLSFRISRIKLKKHYSFKQDTRETTPFKLLFFSGQSGINYLNASLISVYNTWTSLPEVIIVTDGAPASSLQNQLIDWPKKVEIFTWEKCADYYKNKGNTDLVNFASNLIFGRKFVAVFSIAAQFPVLYSDTDVLWYADPTGINLTEKPFIKISEDIQPFYSKPLLNSIEEDAYFEAIPLNSGVIFAHGDFSEYPKWAALCKFLGSTDDHWAEQTAIAVFKNYFKPKDYWNRNEILIQTEDRYSLRPAQKDVPGIFARHYVSNKDVTFWRDFVYMRFKKKRNFS